MPLVVQGPQVGYQAGTPFQFQGAGAANFAQAQAWTSFANTAITVGDIAQKESDRIAQQRAQEDAPQLIKRDGNGILIPPSSFTPSGFTTRAYRDTYERVAKASYLESAAQEFQVSIDAARAATPTDPAAVNAALEKKKQAMTETLDPSVKGLALLRFEGMQGQALSQVNMAVEGEKKQVFGKQMVDANNALVSGLTSVASWNDHLSPDDLKANYAHLHEQWKNVEALAYQSGHSKAFVDQMWKDNYIKVEVARHENEFRQLAFDMKNGQLDGESIALAKRQIDEMAKKYPGHEDAFRAAMNGALNEAIGTSSYAAQGTTQKLMSAQDAEHVAWLNRLKSGGVAPNSPEFQAAINKRISEVLTDTMTPDVFKIRAFGMLTNIAGMAQQDTNQFYQQKFATYGNTISDKTQPMERRVAAYRDVEQLLNDPAMASYMPAGVRSYGERMLTEFRTAELHGDLAGMFYAGPQGKISPETWNDMGVNLRKRGIVGDHGIMSEQEFEHHRAQGIAAWQTNQDNMVQANNGMKNAQMTPGLPSKMQTAAIEAHPDTRFKLSDGARVFDIDNPQHLADLHNFFTRTNVIPAQVKDQLANPPIGRDQKTTEKLASVYNDMANVLINKPGFERENLTPYMNELLGAVPSHYYAAVNRNGYDVATKEFQSHPNSESRNLGTNPTAAKTDTDQAVDRLVGNLGKLAIGNTVASWTGDTFAGLLGYDKAAMTGFAADLVRRGGLDQSMLFAAVGGVNNYSISPEARQIIGEYADHRMVNYGKSYADQLGPDGARDMAVREAMIAKRELLDISRKADGSLEIGLKSFNRQVGEMFGQPGHASDSMTNAYLGATMLARGIDTSGFDRGSLKATLHLNPAGEAYWNMTAQRQGIPTDSLAQININDPSLSAFAGQVNLGTAMLVRRFYHGIGDGPQPSDTGFIAGLMSGTLFRKAGMMALGGEAGLTRATQFALTSMRGADASLGAYRLEDLYGPDALKEDKYLGIQLSALLDMTRKAPASTIDWKRTIDNIREHATPDDLARFRTWQAVAAMPNAPAR